MPNYGRRIVVDADFEQVLGETSRAIRDEGLHAITRIDVRDHFWRDLGEDFDHYYVIQAWSPALAVKTLRANPEVGATLPTTFVVYALPDGRTAVVAKEPELDLMADAEAARAARVLDRLEHTPWRIVAA